MNLIDEMAERFSRFSDEEKAEAQRHVENIRAGRVWCPSPGPQTDAYLSEADVLLFGGEPGGGKGLSLDTPIPTPDGFKTMGELAVGDTVFDKDGVPCSVTMKSDVHHRDCYRVEFSDGESLIADDTHRWLTQTHRERSRQRACSEEWRAKRRANRPSRGKGKRPDLAIANSLRAAGKDLPLEGVRTTAEIYETQRIRERVNHSVTVAGPLQLPEAVLVIDPYTLGAWLGDGSSDCGAITTLDDEILEEVAANGYTIRQRAKAITYGILGLQTKLRALSLVGNKHIPQVYLRASPSQRLALLQGLMDTDGYCDERGQAEFTTTSQALADGTIELINSLGIKAAVSEGRATLNGRDISAKYRIKFITQLPVFRLSRKLIRQKRGGFRGTHDRRFIVAVEPVPSVPTQCIQVDSPSRTYLAGRAMIPTHNSSLLLGLALNEHKRSLIMRRQYTDLGHLTEEACRFNGGREGFNGAPPPRLRLKDGRQIEFFAAAKIGDEQHRQGNPFDFLGVDEATQCAESQIRFLMGWLRSAGDPNQRKRVVFATNPPLSSDGFWVHEWFAPWIGDDFPNPAKYGELRWAYFNDEDRVVWVDGPEPVLYNGRTVNPKSFTFIPSSLSDNPFLAGSGYEKEIDSLPAEVRAILMGGFKVAMRDQDYQVIPSEWVRLAQRRWTPNQPDSAPMCSMGVDCSGGGKDPMVIAARFDGWFAPIVKIDGKDLPLESMGAAATGHVVAHRRDGALVVVDMGGGYGGSLYERLNENSIKAFPYKGAEASTRKTRDGTRGFYNVRSAAYWQLREALDPDQPGGSPIALPPDNELLADLTALTYEPATKLLKVEPKDKVVERLGRSTNKGDAVAMAWYEGERKITHALDWMQRLERPRMVPGGRVPLTARRHAHG